MKPRWKLSVEAFGKIERAEVDVRPLTLFAGPNNSGKSYLVSLLWGLVALPGELVPQECPELEAANAWIAQRVEEGKASFEHDLTVEELGLFDRLFDALLLANRSRLSRRLFHSDSVTLGAISLQRACAERRLRLRWRRGPDGQFVAEAIWSGENGIYAEIDRPTISYAREVARDLVMRAAVLERLSTALPGEMDAFEDFTPVYLPASRTGFMHLYKAAARRSLHETFRRTAERRDFSLDLTTPAFHFIDMLAFGLKSEQSQLKREQFPSYAEEAAFLEQSLTGEVELVAGAGAVNEYRYRPAGTPAPLPMQLSSALVTELAPLVLVLRHLSSFPALILEEPEAHLHPELQRRIAQVIGRLVHKGLFVWVTTHSENFCQEINNLIKLGSLPPDKRARAQQALGYGPNDYLDLDDVSGCELKLDPTGERSTAVAMRRTEAGLVMPTFNRAIVKLSQDVAYLDGLLNA
ncbi:hypothetical protein BE04_24440 [Sorangium cellulosum]|uniref:ATPase AAA-type core domain-containing protein n=2 Tax=Sorangium cellulosum TaxID=56 RepID=A0A150PN84_SORCE|nr:AAA family ATPase [Sorangium cellulosum]AGP42267.1 hypothetical protein SCE1572_51865 [Sorangium cellulosum So0157-2]KYF57165.1 hypothetical protein BE04_24440 [Sorangium cellulosum]